MKKATSYFEPVLIDIRAHPTLKQHYGVGQTPLVVYADPDGKAVWAVDDYQPLDLEMKELTEAIAYMEKEKAAAK